MLRGYEVLPQMEKGEEVFVKRIKVVPTTDKLGNKIGMAPLKSAKGKTLPMLKVVIGNGDTDHRFELRWSNHAEINDNEPGKFKIVRVDLGKPHILYVTDLLSGRKMMNPKTGKPVIDFVAMAVMYGTTQAVDGSRNFGPTQTFEQGDELFGEFEHLRTAFHKLSEMFGEDVARQALRLIKSHELYAVYTAAVAA